MKTLIINGLLADPESGTLEKGCLLLEDGTICGPVSRDTPADHVLDACGHVVSPGFVDIHMHEDPVENGSIYADPARSIFHCMLRMGVTTAIGGNCGDCCIHPADYLDQVDREGTPVHVGMLAGASWFRVEAGALDKYAPATPEQIQNMAVAIGEALDRGCLGLSYGIRYAPGMEEQELTGTAMEAGKRHKLIAAHLRDDADAVFSAAEELLEAGRRSGSPVQLSHIGSMAGYGQMKDFLALVERARASGMDVACDCYPYSAFSTDLGSCTYDPGWLERYRCDYDVLELSEGPYKLQRCTKEIFEQQRRDFPDCKTVCYVMKPEEITLALAHPSVMLCTDGTLSHGQGHPRAAGGFPRFLAEYVRGGSLEFMEALRKMTLQPAERLGLAHKGRLSPGADADLVIFDPDRILDQATFTEPILPPLGIDYVLVNGQIAMDHGVLLQDRLGRSVRR